MFIICGPSIVFTVLRPFKLRCFSHVKILSAMSKSYPQRWLAVSAISSNLGVDAASHLHTHTHTIICKKLRRSDSQACSTQISWKLPSTWYIELGEHTSLRASEGVNGSARHSKPLTAMSTDLPFDVNGIELGWLNLRASFMFCMLSIHVMPVTRQGSQGAGIDRHTP